MKILASYNIKGGVGKTTCIVNLAYLAAREGYRTLLWDLDPQGAASFYFRIQPGIKGGLKGILGRTRPLSAAIKATDYPGLDLIPADPSFRYLDMRLTEHNKPLKQFRKLIRPFDSEYDLVLLDCAPGMSLASENIFFAVDALLVPVIPTTLSVRTLHQIEQYLAQADIESPALLPFFSMLDHRKRLHRETINTLSGQGHRFLQTIIPSASQIEWMGVRRAPLGSYGIQSMAVMAFEKLWEEVRDRIGLEVGVQNGN